MSHRIPIALVLSVLALAACGDGKDPAPVAPGDGATATDPAAGQDATASTGATDATDTTSGSDVEPVIPPKPGAPLPPPDGSGSKSSSSGETESPATAAAGGDESGGGATTKPAGDGDTSKAALAAISKHAQLVQLPTTGVQAFKSRIRLTHPMFGDGLGAAPEWTPDDGLRLNVTFSDELKQQIPEQQRPMIVSMADSQFKPYLGTLFESLDRGLTNYDAKLKTTDQGVRVDLAPKSSEGIQWESLKLYFDERGLATRMVGIRHFEDVDDPQVAILAGTEEEYAFTYVERGKGFAIESIEVTTEIARGRLAITYHDTKTGAALPKEILVESPQMPAPMTVYMNDFELDGKAVEATRWTPPKVEAPAVPELPETPKAPAPPK